MIVGAIVLWGAGAMFRQMLRQTAALGDIARFASVRRTGAVVALVLWCGIGVWLYLRPQYRGWLHAASWAILVVSLASYGIEVWRSGQVDDNRRYAAKLLAESGKSS